VGIDRRGFLRAIGACAAGAAVPSVAQASAAKSNWKLEKGDGLLVDTATCIGCRKCEFACNQYHSQSENKLLTAKPLAEFEDLSVLDTPRRMEHDEFTVVNSYPNERQPGRPINVKMQCMHCLHPACESACLVGAFKRQENGAVTYDSWKCMGCRYCMVACPFQVPSYEYDNTLTPRVRKCTFCYERVTKEGRIPACAELGPVECLTFGKREDLLETAHQKIADGPDLYHDHVYGEHEVGGTSWLYIGPKPMEEVGLLKLGEKPIPEYTEPIQHSIFRFGVPPLLLAGMLGALMRIFEPAEKEDEPSGPGPEGE
jgi:formate dehydrogenase iron-sulfur subunit